LNESLPLPTSVLVSADGDSRSEERETEGHNWRATESTHGTPLLMMWTAGFYVIARCH